MPPFLLAGLQAAPQILSALSGLFGKRKTVTDPQSDWAKQFIGGYTPGQAYGGQFTAGMTPFESLGLGKLDEYLKGGATGPTFAQGNQQLLDTLSGKYMDPNTNPIIQSLMGLHNQNLADQLNQSRGQAGARGNYFSTAAMGNENLLRERSLNDFNAQASGILGAERGRQFAAIPLAQQYDQYNNQAQLQQVGASQTFGSLERTIQQADLERRYADFQRQRGELGKLPGMLQGSVSQNQPNPLLDMLSKLNIGGAAESGNIWDIFKNSAIYN